MDTKQKPEITRRDFLKASGTVTAVTLLGQNLFGDAPTPFSKHFSPTAAAGQDEWVYSWCRQCALPPCGTKIHVKDGVAIKVEGNPASPNSQGQMCVRGNATLAGVYNPYRVKTPLKRTNPKKGMDQDPGWVEISWEEAYDTIAKELKRVRADDPRKFVWFNGFSRSGSMLEGMEFCEAYGTPNYIEVDGPNCSVHFGASLLLGNFVGARYDPNHTNYLIQLGEGSNASAGYAGVTREFTKALRRGMKVVVIDPKLTVEASKGEWVPIRPGTDLAFVLAMQHVMLYELKKFDMNFLKSRTNAPYLVGPDGHYLRDKETGKPMMWHVQDKRAKPFDDPSFMVVPAPAGPPAAGAPGGAPAAGAPAAGAPAPGGAPAPAAPPAPPAPVPLPEQLTALGLWGRYMVDDVIYKPAFQIYYEGMKEYTPEWAEKLTTVSAATIRRIAKEFVEAARIGSTITIEGTTMPYRPVSLQGARGSITQFYGGHFHCATIITNMLVGALDVPGGAKGDLGPQHKCTPYNMALKPDEDGTVAPKVEAVPRAFEFPPNRLDGKTYFPFSHDNPHITMDAILDPQKYHLDYTPEVMLAWGGNMVLRCFQPEKALEALKKFKFIFALSYSLDEPAWMADIVLPESGGLERWAAGTRGVVAETKEGMKQVVYGVIAQPAIDPVFDSKQPDEVFIELAERIGMLYGENGMNAMINRGNLTPVKLVDPYLLDLNKKYTSQELTSLVVKSAFGEQASVEACRNNPEVPKKVLPNKAAYPYGGFPGSQTRYAIYMDRLKTYGEDLIANLEKFDAFLPGLGREVIEPHFSPVIHWIEKPGQDAANLDLYAINWKPAQFTFGVGGAADNPWLHEVSQFDPYLHVVCLNPKVADDRGLKDGDLVWVESKFGKVQGRVKVSGAFHHEVVGIGGLFGHTSPGMNPLARLGMHFNNLMSPNVEDCDPLGGGFDGAPRVKVYKA